VEQTNAPELLPHPLPFELKLPVVVVQKLKEDGAVVKLSPLMLPLGEKPRSTDPIKSLVEVTAPVIVIVSVADVEVMSNEYVAAGQPEPPPQSERVSVPIVSALATPPKMTQKTNVTTKLNRLLFMLPPSSHV